MVALIIIFALISAGGLLGIALSKDESKREGNKLVSIRDLITVRKICTYIFLIFFLLTSLQINVDYGGFQTTVQTYSAYNVITNSMTANVPLFCSGAMILTSCGTTTETSNTIASYMPYTITTIQNPLSQNLLTANILVFISALMLVVVLITDLMQIFTYLVEKINQSR